MGTEKSNEKQAGEVLVALCTAPDLDTAGRLARGLVEQRLAACVNQFPAVHSVYRWGKRIEQDNEVLLMAKTTRETSEALVAWLVAEHPYDTPEVLLLPVSGGADDYLDWVRGNAQPA